MCYVRTNTPRTPTRFAARAVGGRAWRWRKCPRCAVVLRASDFEVADNYRAAWLNGGMRRQCPECGFTGPTRGFTVVRERRAP